MKNVTLGVFAALTFMQAGFIYGYWLKGVQDVYIEKITPDKVKITDGRSQ